MNLLESISGLITPDLVSKMTSIPGVSEESQSGILKAMQCSAPTVLAGLTQSASTEDGASKLLGWLSHGSMAKVVDGVGNLTPTQTQAASSEGQEFLSRIFGERAGGIVDLISRTAGIRSGSARGVLGLVGSLAGGLLSKQVLSAGLDANGLRSFLGGQKRSLTESPYLPAGLASALGLGSLASLGGSITDFATSAGRRIGGDVSHAASELRDAARRSVRPGIESPDERPSRWASLLPVALLAAVGLFGWSWMRHRHEARQAQENALRRSSIHQVERLRQTASHIQLPNGNSVNVDEQSGEARLAQALGSSTASFPESFALGGLTFDTASSALAPVSRERIDSVAQILKAYPNARIRVEGHTDNVGAPESNMSLSNRRAEIVRKQLVADGVAPERIETAAFGSQRPIAANNTEEGRARNRRIEIVVLNR